MIINFQNVTYKIPAGETIYKNFSLKVFEGDFYGILGKNGAGKSTLIEMIMGMRQLSGGKIEVLGEDPTLSDRIQKKHIFVVSHDIQIPSNISVKEMLSFYKFFYPNYCQKTQEELLELFEIGAQKKFGSLSTGQKVKAMLCAAFASHAKLYLFDEVTAVLDPRSRRNFFKYLKEFRKDNNCSLLMATNIAEDLVNCVDRVLFIGDNHEVKIKDAHSIDDLFEDKKDIA